jgi:hypothetical protein
VAAERRNVKTGKNWIKVLVGIRFCSGQWPCGLPPMDYRFHWSNDPSSLAFTQAWQGPWGGSDRLGHAIQRVLFFRGSDSEGSRAQSSMAGLIDSFGTWLCRMSMLLL